MKVLFFILTSWLAIRAHAGCETVAAWNAGLDFEQVEFQLATAKPVKIELLEDYFKRKGRKFQAGPSNQLYLVTLEGGMRGVAKFSETMKPLQASHGAYHIARAMGFNLIPPTTLREFRVLGKRTALFQYFIDSTFDLLDLPQRGKAFEKISAKNRSDLTILKVLLGRWDNHKGNELIDITGTPALIDSDEILDLQQLRYGEFPYIKYGEQLTLFPEDLDTTLPFPFDEPHDLTRINWENLRWRFCTYLPDSAMRKLYDDWVRRKFVNDTIYSIDWNGHTWIQWAMKNEKPLYTKVYSRDTIENISLVETSDLRNVLSSAFSDLHIRFILERRDQIVSASQRGEQIP